MSVLSTVTEEKVNINIEHRYNNNIMTIELGIQDLATIEIALDNFTNQLILTQHNKEDTVEERKVRKDTVKEINALRKRITKHLEVLNKP